MRNQQTQVPQLTPAATPKATPEFVVLRSVSALDAARAYPVRSLIGNTAGVVVYAHPSVCREIAAAIKLPEQWQPAWLSEVLAA